MRELSCLKRDFSFMRSMVLYRWFNKTVTCWKSQTLYSRADLTILHSLTGSLKTTTVQFHFTLHFKHRLPSKSGWMISTGVLPHDKQNSESEKKSNYDELHSLSIDTTMVMKKLLTFKVYLVFQKCMHHLICENIQINSRLTVVF